MMRGALKRPIAKDSTGKAIDALETATGRDIDGDGDIGGK